MNEILNKLKIHFFQIAPVSHAQFLTSNQIEFQSLIIIMIKALIWLSIYLVASAYSACYDYLKCYKTKLFNFDYPHEGIYQQEFITKNTQNNYQMLGYADFNNDLMTDFAAKLSDENGTIAIYIWDQDSSYFIETALIAPANCQVDSVFLYDVNVDGFIDITVWGQNGNQNCLIPYLQTSSDPIDFSPGIMRIMQKTSQPFVVSYGENNGRQKENTLCVYQNGSRVLLKYSPSLQDSYQQVQWDLIFSSSTSFADVPFANPHWNSYVDLTGDCQSDVIIIDDAFNVQLWVWASSKKMFVHQNSLPLSNLYSLSFSDMDYSGTLDLILAYSNKIQVKFNDKSLSSANDFCCQGCETVKFKDQGMSLSLGKGEEIVSMPLHIGDVDINGYPDLLLPISNGTHQSVAIFFNEEGSNFNRQSNYGIKLKTTGEIKSVSFIDFLENGILDFIITVEQEEQTYSVSFVNNNLQQNYFYIKGYGASGSNSTQGCQFVGASFYWVNSLGENIRLAYNPQVIQTAYNALQLPFAYSGLGRANNYVESFTLGAFGQSGQWSPIIPNSQLVVYAPSSDTSEWGIRIFVLPTQSLIYVVIVSVILLTILGSVLLFLKCKQYRKKEQPLMEFIH